jgi:hypothetical protein
MSLTVTLKKTREASPKNLSGRSVPASYDVFVGDVLVGSLEGRSPGRGTARPFHELRELTGKPVSGMVAVRGNDRLNLNRLALALFEVLAKSS